MRKGGSEWPSASAERSYPLGKPDARASRENINSRGNIGSHTMAVLRKRLQRGNRIKVAKVKQARSDGIKGLGYGIQLQTTESKQRLKFEAGLFGKGRRCPPP